MEEVVVTGTRVEEPIRNIPKNVTVITREDIEQAPSNNVVDLLAREANVNLRSFFGNDKQAGVDIRGMGDTFVSNVIVMVDGYRLNPPDLAGPDFSTIPLDNIERIEILRGAGAVLYGDGAVGGVINIITRKGEKKPEGKFYGSYGSFETIDGRALYGGRVKRLSFNVNAGYYDSNGYRENGFFDKKDAGTRLQYDLTDAIALLLNASYHDDEYGLPGPVNREDKDDKDARRATMRPDDGGETEDGRAMGGVRIDLGRWGNAEIHRGYRSRDNHYVQGFNPLLPRSEQTDHIDEDTRMFDMTYFKDYRLWERDHRIKVGFDHFKTEYYREELSRNSRENSEIKRRGVFAMNRWSLLENLTFDVGYRYHWFDGIFRNDQRQRFGTDRIWVNGIPFQRKWHNDSYDIGLLYSINENHSIFGNYATSFRTPNADEFALADNDLRPQEGKHMDIGSRHLLLDICELSVTLFQMEITDEIYYGEDPTTGIAVNRNFDEKTIRRGLEADIKIYPID